MYSLIYPSNLVYSLFGQICRRLNIVETSNTWGNMSANKTETKYSFNAETNFEKHAFIGCFWKQKRKIAKTSFSSVPQDFRETCVHVV